MLSARDMVIQRTKPTTLPLRRQHETQRNHHQRHHPMALHNMRRLPHQTPTRHQQHRSLHPIHRRAASGFVPLLIRDSGIEPGPYDDLLLLLPGFDSPRLHGLGWLFHQWTQFIVSNSTSVADGQARRASINSILYNPFTISATRYCRHHQQSLRKP